MSVIHVNDLTADEWFGRSELTDSKDSEERWRRSAKIRFHIGADMGGEMTVFTTYLSPRPIVERIVEDPITAMAIVDIPDIDAAKSEAVNKILDSIEKWEIADRSLPGTESDGVEPDTDLPLDDIRPGDWALHKSNSLDERPVFGVDYEQGLVWLGMYFDAKGRPTEVFGPMSAANYHFYRGKRL